MTAGEGSYGMGRRKGGDRRGTVRVSRFTRYIGAERRGGQRRCTETRRTIA